MIALITAIPFVGPYLAGAILFFASPFGRAVLIAGVAFVGGYQVKAHLDTSAELRAHVAKLRGERDAANTAAADASQKVAELSAADAILRQRTSDYAQALARQNDRSCILTDDDLHRRVRKRK